jgi:hypothetical protein
MQPDALTRQLKRLVIGMADQEILAGRDFFYDGGRLHADEVADLMLPSVVCIAQDLSDRLELGSFGYRFKLGASDSAAFPLTMEFVADGSVDAKRFFEVAPFVVEVFEGEVVDCRLDLARLFESAARLVREDFSLDRHTNYAELAA